MAERWFYSRGQANPFTLNQTLGIQLVDNLANQYAFTINFPALYQAGAGPVVLSLDAAFKAGALVLPTAFAITCTNFTNPLGGASLQFQGGGFLPPVGPINAGQHFANITFNADGSYMAAFFP